MEHRVQYVSEGILNPVVKAHVFFLSPCSFYAPTHPADTKQDQSKSSLAAVPCFYHLLTSYLPLSTALDSTDNEKYLFSSLFAELDDTNFDSLVNNHEYHEK